VSDDRRDGCIAFQGDMAAHQAMTGREVTAEANRQLAAEEFARLEASGVFDQQAAPEPAPPPAPEREVTHHDVDGKRYLLTKEPDAPSRLIAQSDVEKALSILALQRVRMLLELEDTGILGAPSWRARACAVMALGPLHPGFPQALADLLEDSSRLFGDWRREPQRKIFLT
jgi:hypothetical protein